VEPVDRDDAAITSLLRRAPIVSFRLDREARVVAWNDLIAGIAGIPAEEAIGRDVAEVLPTPEGAAGWRALLEQPAGTRRVWPTTHRSGATMHAAYIVQPLVGPDGERRGALMWGRDLTAEVEAERRREQELAAGRGVIERQERAIRELRAPVLEVWDRVVALPLVGELDAARTAEVMDRLLQEVVRVRARFAILDLTGVDAVDASTAGHLVDLVRAIRLLGAEGVLTGVHPSAAAAIVGLGADLSHLSVHATLRAALHRCIAALQARG
jgi:rsbT co-antagonist protein RsbR